MIILAPAILASSYLSEMNKIICDYKLNQLALHYQKQLQQLTKDKKNLTKDKKNEFR